MSKSWTLRGKKNLRDHLVLCDQVVQFIYLNAVNLAMGKRCLKVEIVLVHLLFHITWQSEMAPVPPDLELGASKTKKQAEWSTHSGGGGNSSGSNSSHIRIPGPMWQHPLSKATSVVTQAVACSVHWKQDKCDMEVWSQAVWAISASVWTRGQLCWVPSVSYPKSPCHYASPHSGHPEFHLFFERKSLGDGFIGDLIKVC